MIEATVLLLQKKLQEHLSKNDPFINVTIDNIGMWGTPEGDRLSDHIVITVINIEEETALQNLLPLHDRIDHVLPLHFNLYVLFTSNYPNDYLMALRSIDQILQFFNNTLIFFPNEENEHQFRFAVQLCSLNFEEINHLWNSFGVKQLPFVIYKLKVTENTEE